MKKIFLFLILALFLISLVSGSVFLEKEPNELYNLQDKIELTLKINPDIEFNNLLTIVLDCPTGKTEIYKEYLFLNENITKNLIIPLVKEFIGNNKGLCQIQSKIENKTDSISEKFIISNKIEITLEKYESLTPGQTTIIKGQALRENGKTFNGLIEAKIKINDDDEIFIKENITNGVFLLNFEIPKNSKAGDRIIKLYAYETNSKSQITNEGNSTSMVVIKQIPTNIEIQLEKKEILSGENLKFTIVLHDQTGENIDSMAYVAIKNFNEEIIEQIKRPTDELIEYQVKYDEAPNTWSISAYVKEIINKVEFTIKENKKIELDIINKTLIVSNKGNVLYNESLSIKLGGETIKLPVYLNVNQKELYLLSAPEGEHNVEIGNFSEKVSLTGNTIKIKKLSNSKGELSSTIAWIFLILILGFVAYVIFKKTQKKNFFARLVPSKKKKDKIVENKNLTGFINPKTKSEISLSISGSKQNACIGCISFKNYKEIKIGIGNVRETLQKITELVEENKGFMYQNNDNLFFILAPVKTKTFQNEHNGVKIADKIKFILEDHNKRFKQKIDFGISLNYGTIITKQENTKLKFMSMGTLLNTAKKLAKHAKKEIYIGQKVKERLGNEIKTELKHLGTISVHLFKEIKTTGQHTKFIDGFVARQKKEIAKKEHEAKQKQN